MGGLSDLICNNFIMMESEINMITSYWTNQNFTQKFILKG